jgi:hypothetical protein
VEVVLSPIRLYHRPGNRLFNREDAAVMMMMHFRTLPTIGARSVRTPPTPPTPRPGRVRAALVALVAGAAVGLPPGEPGSARAQSGVGGVAGAAVDVSAITGRELGSVELPSSVQAGDVRIRANRAWAWSEGEGGAGGLGATQRLYLQGDVRIELGKFTFTAAQAVVWVRTDGPGRFGDADDPDRQVRSIAVQFDRVSDPGAQAGFAQAADRLLVTARMDGLVDVRADALRTGRVSTGAEANFLRESEQRLARHLKQIAGGEQAVAGLARVEGSAAPGVVSGPILPGRARPYEPNSPIARRPMTDLAETARAGGAVVDDPLFTRGGVVSFAVGTRSVVSPTAPEFGDPVGDGASSEFIRLVRGAAGEGVEGGGGGGGGEADNTLLLLGGVAVQYTDVRRTRNLMITAERGVVFLAPGPITDMARMGAEQIRGVYLEGDVVATDGQYTLRGPRVYYDLQNNRAVMAEAVFSTVDPKLGIPIYVRAKTLRQEAANRFTAEGARLATSSFFEPVFSVGASTISVTQRADERAGGQGAEGPRTFFETGWLTLRAGGVPFMVLPGFSGEVEDIPLEDITVENSSENGAAIKTTWNAFSALGIRPPQGVKVRALLDYYFERGPGLGTQTDWDTRGLGGAELKGSLLAYTVPVDSGTDVLSTGAKRDVDDEFRGIVLADNVWKLSEHWTLFAEAAVISDATFVDAFFREQGREAREFTTAAELRYLEGNQRLGILAKANLQDFVSNQYLVQSQGYSVNKLPEVTYARVADDILPGVQPGLLTWTHEYSASRMRFVFDATPVRDLGFTSDFLAQRSFGVNADQSIADRLRAAGYTREDVMRADTRQELVATMEVLGVKVSPFVVGRFTAYDQKLGDFSSLAPADKLEEQYRAFWAGGTRLSTTFTRVDDSVENSLLDLHRVRHIVEPNATVWAGGTTLTQDNLPVYDDTVESLNSGSAVRAGINQTWQTQRGGPGRWRSVDVLRLNTDVVFSSSDADKESPIGRFNEARPEYSFLGDYFTADLAWQATDVVGLVFSTVYDLDINQPARTVAGGTIQHNPEFSSYAQVRYLNALDATYVDAGVTYQLTRKYTVGAGLTYDTDENDVQEVSGTLRRRFSDATLGVRLGYNNIIGETSVSAVFEPVGVRDNLAETAERLRDVRR